MSVGQVVRSHSHQYYILIDGQEVLCRPRGKFRLDKQGVLAGDWVEVHVTGDEGRIDRILPRKSVLQRPPIANVDQALVLFTLREPEPDYAFLDRVLIHTARAGIETLILLNKIDLLTDEEVEGFRRCYGDQAGYPVVAISAKTGNGLPTLEPLLRERLSVLSGHSGVGKSRLVRALEPSRRDIRVGDLSERLGKGKHTTRHVELIPLMRGGLVADAPGFTHLEFEQVQRSELSRYFPEFQQYALQCRFLDCMHDKEPDCAVRTAVASGAITHSRHENYLLFLAEVEAQKRW